MRRLETFTTKKGNLQWRKVREEGFIFNILTRVQVPEAPSSPPHPTPHLLIVGTGYSGGISSPPSRKPPGWQQPSACPTRRWPLPRSSRRRRPPPSKPHRSSRSSTRIVAGASDHPEADSKGPPSPESSGTGLYRELLDQIHLTN